MLHIVLPLSGLLLIVLKRELPHILLLEHVSLTEGAHGDHTIILDRPDTCHAIHRSSEDYWNVSLLDVLDRLNHILVRLPLCYLDKLEFLEQGLNLSFLVIAGMLTDIITVDCKTNLSLINGEDPPWVPFKVSGNYIDWLEVEFNEDGADILNPNIAHLICYDQIETPGFSIVEGINCRYGTHLLKCEHVSPANQARMSLWMRFG